MRARFATIVLCGAAACGGSDLEPGAGNSAGNGSRTLVIDGSARAQPRVINAHNRIDFDTELSVRVVLGAEPVSSGTVAVTSITGKTALTYGSDNRWSGSAPGYDQVYVLDVVSGSDKVEGVRVDGPDIHVFVRPAAGDTVDASMPLLLTWRRSDKADTATLHAENIDAFGISDTGVYALPPGALATDKNLARPNLLRLTRTNRVVPAGAGLDSTWTVSIDNTLDVVARPQGIPLTGDAP